MSGRDWRLVCPVFPSPRCSEALKSIPGNMGAVSVPTCMVKWRAFLRDRGRSQRSGFAGRTGRRLLSSLTLWFPSPAPSLEVSEVSCEPSCAVTSVWHSCLPWEGAASAWQWADIGRSRGSCPSPSPRGVASTEPPSTGNSAELLLPAPGHCFPLCPSWCQGRVPYPVTAPRAATKWPRGASSRSSGKL